VSFVCNRWFNLKIKLRHLYQEFLRCNSLGQPPLANMKIKELSKEDRHKVVEKHRSVEGSKKISK